LGDGEVHFTAYSLRNISSTTPITVERVRIFDATGSVLVDSTITGLPPFQEGVYLGPTTNLGVANNVLGPNQTTGLNSDQVLPFLPAAQRSLQVEFVWSASARVLVPEVAGVRIVRERNSATGAQLAERARFGINCRAFALRQ
jgi:hypothetical protein